jgi:hypothetical protein
MMFHQEKTEANDDSLLLQPSLPCAARDGRRDVLLAWPWLISAVALCDLAAVAA